MNNTLESVADIPKEASILTVRIEYGGKKLMAHCALWPTEDFDESGSFEFAVFSELVDVETEETVLLNDFPQSDAEEIYEMVADALQELVTKIIEKAAQEVLDREENKKE